MSTRHIKFWRYYKQWIDTYKKGQVRPITYARWDLASRWIKENYPDVYLDKITRMQVQQMINKYGETHEKASAYNFLHCLEAPLKDAAYEGWVSKDPTYKIKVSFQKPHTATRAMWLEEDETKKLVQVLNKHNDVVSAMFDFDLRTGLRFAEVLGLTPQDIDQEQMTITVNKSWDYKGSEGGGFMDTKNASSHRTIVIDKKAMDSLKHVMFGVHQDEPIFPTALTIEQRGVKKIKRFKTHKLGIKHDKRYVRIFSSTINKKLQRCCEEAGIPRITFHNLRHTHASLLISEGVSLEYVAERLGHSTTYQTQKTYVHLLDKIRQENNETMRRVLGDLG